MKIIPLQQEHGCEAHRHRLGRPWHVGQRYAQADEGWMYNN